MRRYFAHCSTFHIVINVSSNVVHISLSFLFILSQSEEEVKVEKVKSVFGFQGKAKGGDDDDDEEEEAPKVNPNRQAKPAAKNLNGTDAPADPLGGMTRKER